MRKLTGRLFYAPGGGGSRHNRETPARNENLSAPVQELTRQDARKRELNEDKNKLLWDMDELLWDKNKLLSDKSNLEAEVSELRDAKDYLGETMQHNNASSNQNNTEIYRRKLISAYNEAGSRQLDSKAKEIDESLEKDRFGIYGEFLNVYSVGHTSRVDLDAFTNRDAEAASTIFRARMDHDHTLMNIDRNVEGKKERTKAKIASFAHFFDVQEKQCSDLRLMLNNAQMDALNKNIEISDNKITAVNRQITAVNRQITAIDGQIVTIDGQIAEIDRNAANARDLVRQLAQANRDEKPSRNRRHRH